jgi:4'-phosphopantetheinyl transferase
MRQNQQHMGKRLKEIPTIEHWHPSKEPPPLPPGALHLWRIPTGNRGAPLAGLWSLLSRRESKRAGKLRLDLHRARYVRAQAGLRAILSRYINIAPPHIDFKYGKHGKPQLANGDDSLELNLTTSGDLALVAICAGEPVGVDCEQVRERRDAAAIARKMFTTEAASAISAAEAHERLALFHLAWTALEANVKADGRGLCHRAEAPAQGMLDIGHCVPEHGFIAAVARRDLPPVVDWKTLELASG